MTGTEKQYGNADDFLTALHEVYMLGNDGALLFAAQSKELLREAADLCGVDSTDMSKAQAIKAIRSNF